MIRTKRVRKPSKGRPGRPPRSREGYRAGRGEGRLRLWDAGRLKQSLRGTIQAAKRVRGDRAKFRSRPSSSNPRRESPREHPATDVLNTREFARDFGKGYDPETEAREAGRRLRLRFLLPSRTVGGFIPAQRCGILYRGRKLRRVNPKSAAGAKESRHGIAGRKPSRG
jgi:hypothetical protein